jgi:hypothetical protein
MHEDEMLPFLKSLWLKCKDVVRDGLWEVPKSEASIQGWKVSIVYYDIPEDDSARVEVEILGRACLPGDLVETLAGH